MRWQAFLNGLMRVLDIRSTPQVREILNRDPNVVDSLAIQSDWQHVVPSQPSPGVVRARRKS